MNGMHGLAQKSELRVAKVNKCLVTCAIQRQLLSSNNYRILINEI